MPLLDQATPGLQFAIWGAAWAGDVGEITAAVSEHRPGMWLPDQLWDRDAAFLASIERWRAGVRLPAPQWWALAVAPDLVAAGAA